jgi:hypothetical protein
LPEFLNNELIQLTEATVKQSIGHGNDENHHHDEKHHHGRGHHKHNE